jgi:diguanylate cyclase (GGDEF)-like protein
MKFSHLSHFSNLSAFLAGIALFLSALALLGHAIHMPILTSLMHDQQQMVIITAIVIFMAALAVLLQNLYHSPTTRTFLKLIALILIVVGILALLEFMFNTSWLDFDALHQYNPKLNPGRMAFNTAICFILLGGAMFLRDLDKQKSLYHAGVLCVTLLAIFSGLGVLSFAANFEFLSSFGHNNRMALPTALSFLTLTIAISLTQKPNNDQRDEISSSKLYLTLELLLVCIVIIVALVSFASSQQRVETMMANQLEKVALQSRDYFDTAFTLHHDAAVLNADKTEFTEVLLKYRDNPKLAFDQYLNSVNALDRGFLMLSLEDPQHVEVYRTGQTLVSEQPIRIFQNPDSYLLWNDGYILRTSVPKFDGAGALLGNVVVEQRMDEITRFHQSAISASGTADLVLCALRDRYQICYPFRWNRSPAKYYGYLNSNPLPVTRAAGGFTDTAITTDFRKERVMASIAPVGQTGLGIAVKIDLHELYQPIRNQFYASLPIFILLIIFSLLLMRIKLKPLIDDIERSRRKFGKMALQDPLTGLANRTLFNDRLEFAISKLSRSNKKIGLVYLDVDYFKVINDAYGHLVGDQVLIWFGNKLKESVRQSDTVARIGGDEFSIIIEDVQNSADVAGIVHLIIEKLNHQPAILEKGPVKKVTASLGVAVTSNNLITTDHLIQCADQALYRAKQKGRNTFELVDID